MKFGVALPMFDLQTGRTLHLAELAEFGARADALGFDSLWVMDHFWLDNAGARRTGGHEPMMALAYLAAQTSRITLGSLVLCNSFRNPGQLAREAAALADAAEGRLILGLGSGWSRAEHEAFGFPFEGRTDRFAATLAALPTLLGGGSWNDDSGVLPLRRAQVLTTAPRPPVWVAAFQPRLLQLTAQYAEGWNTAWHGPDTGRFDAELAQLRQQIAAVGRDPAALEISVGLWVIPVAGEELAAAERRAELLKPGAAPASWPSPLRERAITGTPEDLADAMLAYGRRGAQHVILNLSVTPFSHFDAAYLGRAAEAVRLVRNADAGVVA